MKPTNHFGIFEDRGNIYTQNSNKGISVYGERLFTTDGKEYRQWDPKRSKLGAAIMKHTKLPNFKKDQTWLYLGCSYGTTVSHISDFCQDGFIYALDFAPRVIRDFLFMIEKRKNVAPLLGDATKPLTYANRVSKVDILFQDIAQKFQVDIFLKNMMFLKDDGYGILAIKARSIDVSKRPRQIFDEVKARLNKEVKILDYKTLDPFEADHCVFVVQKK